MLCSIEGCNDSGKRNLRSLKNPNLYEIKLVSTGKVCEKHYRQDLRIVQKVNKFELFCSIILENENILNRNDINNVK